MGEGALPLTTMAQLTKDSVEGPQTAAVAGTTQSAPQSKPAPAGAQLRADARSLEIPVKVHGSRVSEAPQGAAPRTEPFEEQTSTMIVFPQGSVIRMSTAVNVGQMLVVTNLKTRQDAICRVVKVRTFTNMQGYVEVEFTHKQEGYWGVQFSGNNAAPANGSVLSTASPQLNAPVASTPVNSVSASRPVVVPPPPIMSVAPAVPAAPVKNVHVVESAPVSSTIDAKPFGAPPAPQFVAPSVAPVVPPPPVPQTIHAAPLPPPTFVPPPPPPPASAAPVSQQAHVAPPPPPVAKPQTPFVWIGTQEEVQPAASATATVKPGASAPFSRTIAPSPEPPKIHVPAIELPGLMPEATHSAHNTVLPFPSSAPEPSVAPLPSQLTMSELRGDASSPVLNATSAGAEAAILDRPESAEEEPAESSRAVFGSLSGASFGAGRVESSEAGLSSPEDLKGARSSSNRTLVAVCVGVVFAAVIGGGLYFRSQSAKSGNGQTGARSTLQSQQVAAEQDALQNSSHAGPVATVEGIAAPAVTVSASGNNSAASKASPVSKQPVSKTAAMMNGATIEHPVTSQRADNSDLSAAPSLDPSAVNATNGNALPGLISSSSLPAPVAPAPQPETPVVRGGHVGQPKLIYRALPIYPSSAKQAGIQGDVVINTKIDSKGNVVDMHVVSGPAMLRQAAVDALRRWRYEPSTLDGQPISVQMLVTIKFSR